MIEDAKRSIAFLCPVCRQPVILERTVFQLAASGSRLPCPCLLYTSENLEQGVVKQFHWEDVAGLPRDGSVTLLDARTPGEYSGGCAEGFVNVPLDELRDHLGEIAPGKPVYVMCQSGLRSYLACRILAQEMCIRDRMCPFSSGPGPCATSMGCC